MRPRKEKEKMGLAVESMAYHEKNFLVHRQEKSSKEEKKDWLSRPSLSRKEREEAVCRFVTEKKGGEPAPCRSRAKERE